MFNESCDYSPVKLRRKIRRGGLGLLLVGLLSGPVLSAVVDQPFFRAASVVIVFGASDFEENGGEAPIVYDFYVLDNATSGQAASDLIAEDGTTTIFNAQTINPIPSGVGSGWEFEILDPTFGGDFTSTNPHQTLDANDSYSAFGLDNATDVDLLGNNVRSSRFFVASNVPFDIFGQASNLTRTGDFTALDYDNIRYRLRYDVSGGSGGGAWGASAQDPAPSGDGILFGEGPNVTLEGLVAAPVKIFEGEQRTAGTPGSIMDQAVSFRSRYNLIGASIDGSNYDFSQGIGTIAADVTFTIYTP